MDKTDPFFVLVAESARTDQMTDSQVKRKAEQLGRLALPANPGRTKAIRKKYPDDFNAKLCERKYLFSFSRLTRKEQSFVFELGVGGQAR